MENSYKLNQKLTSDGTLDPELEPEVDVAVGAEALDVGTGAMLVGAALAEPGRHCE